MAAAFNNKQGCAQVLLFEARAVGACARFAKGDQKLKSSSATDLGKKMLHPSVIMQYFLLSYISKGIKKLLLLHVIITSVHARSSYLVLSAS